MDQSSITTNEEQGSTRDIVAKVINWGIFSGSRKALVTYVELKEYKNGGDRQAQCQSGTLNLEEIAQELNITAHKEVYPISGVALFGEIKLFVS